MDLYQQLAIVLQRDLKKARTTAPSDAIDKARRGLINDLPAAGLGDRGKLSAPHLFCLPLDCLLTCLGVSLASAV